MVELIGLVKDGNEQPQFFMLIIKYPNRARATWGQPFLVQRNTCGQC